MYQWNGENYVMRSLNDLYSSLNIDRVFKSRRILAGHVAAMWKRRTQGFGGETRGKETTWETQV
jgi:hypothetical protein